MLSSPEWTGKRCLRCELIRDSIRRTLGTSHHPLPLLTPRHSSLQRTATMQWPRQQRPQLWRAISTPSSRGSVLPIRSNSQYFGIRQIQSLQILTDFRSEARAQPIRSPHPPGSVALVLVQAPAPAPLEPAARALAEEVMVVEVVAVVTLATALVQEVLSIHRALGDRCLMWRVASRIRRRRTGLLTTALIGSSISSSGGRHTRLPLAAGALCSRNVASGRADIAPL